MTEHPTVPAQRPADAPVSKWLADTLDKAGSIELCVLDAATNIWTRHYLSDEDIAVVANAVNAVYLAPSEPQASPTQDVGNWPHSTKFPEMNGRTIAAQVFKLADNIEAQARNVDAVSFPDIIEGNWKLIVEALRRLASQSPAATSGLSDRLLDGLTATVESLQSELAEEKEAHKFCQESWNTVMNNLRAREAELARAAAQVEGAVRSFRAIQKATIEGRVCDDVAWFSDIETLHDYCAVAADKLEGKSNG